MFFSRTKRCAFLSMIRLRDLIRERFFVREARFIVWMEKITVVIAKGGGDFQDKIVLGSYQ